MPAGPVAGLHKGKCANQGKCAEENATKAEDEEDAEDEVAEKKVPQFLFVVNRH